jgi:hypothetical protein
LPFCPPNDSVIRDRHTSVGSTLTVPIYQGGRVAAQVRQNNESLGQARIEVDVTRDQVRAAWHAQHGVRCWVRALDDGQPPKVGLLGSLGCWPPRSPKNQVFREANNVSFCN